MSFKRKLRRAAERKGFTAEEIERFCRLVMQIEKIQQIEVISAAGGIDITFIPDKDYSDSGIVNLLCEGIYLYMLDNKIPALTISAPAAKIKNTLLPFPHKSKVF